MLIERAGSLLEKCRLCLTNGSTLKSLFHLNEDTTNINDLVDKISKCLNIKIKEDDKFSKLICETCMNNVKHFYEFWTNSNQAQELLTQQFSNNFENVATEDEPSADQVTERTFVNVKNEPDNIEEYCVEEDSSSDKLETQSSNDVDPLAINYHPVVVQKPLAVNTPPRLLNNQSVLNTQNTIKEISSSQSYTMFLIIRSVNENQSTNQTERILCNSTSQNSNNNFNSVQTVTIVKNVSGSLNNQPSTSHNNKNVADPRHNSNLITCVLKDKNSVETTYTVNIRTLNSTSPETKEENKCEYCGKLFLNKYRLEAHRRRHTGEKPFVFDVKVCNERIASKTDAALHNKRSPTNERPYSCKVCQKSFKRKAGFNAHFKIRSEQENYHCDVCCYSSFTLSLLNQHKKSHIHLYKYICEHCGNGFLFENDFFKHKLVHNRMYDCNICGEKFIDLLKLKEHKKAVHKVSCPICNKKINKKALNLHIRRDHQGKRYHCYYCSLQVTSRASIINHLQIHTGEKPFKCFICRKQFNTLAILKLHVKVVHSKDTRYVCKICNKRYSQKSSLNAHIKKVHLLHDNSLSLKCNKCGIIADNQLSLQMHKDNVHNEHTYKCNECNIEVKNKSSIIIHLRKHNGNKPYECPDCKQCFISRKKLKSHQFKHIPFIETAFSSSTGQTQPFHYDSIDVKEEIICGSKIIKEESKM